MRVIEARNVNHALLAGIATLRLYGRERDSRNGPVLLLPTPLTTVYKKPLERVVFWPERDANPFLHLYESLWMIAGREDVEPLARYAKQMREYSDDGKRLHGAYGFRWRNAWDPIDQLFEIAKALKKNPDDRRCVLQMWDAQADLGRNFKDVPCNVVGHFQVNFDGELDLTIFCRSNDIIWGAYGANAVHFSFLLEYMAHWISRPVGVLYQVSDNWHGYRKTFDPLAQLPELYDATKDDHYRNGEVRPLLLPSSYNNEELTRSIVQLLANADQETFDNNYTTEFYRVTQGLLHAHHLWRTLEGKDRFTKAMEVLNALPADIDFVRAAREWMTRRALAWVDKQYRASETKQ